MSSGKSIKITTPKQFEKLVDLMEKNPHLGRGFSKNLQKINVKEEWHKISEDLNKLGPPLRNGEGWMKVWSDYKCKLKKKLIHNKLEYRATGGGPNKLFHLSPTEEAAANLLQLNSIITPEGKTFGAERRQSVTTEPETNRTDVSLDEGSCDDIEEPSTSKLQPTRKRKTKKNEKNDLLSEQLKVQTELYTEVKKSLLEIVKYSRRTCHLKEEKLKLYKQELKRKAEHQNVLAQIKLDEVEIKRKKLELDELKNKHLKDGKSSGESISNKNN